jgi:hypothetical protein
MPQIENVTPIIVRTPQGGRPDGINYARETGGNARIPALLPKKATKKGKWTLLAEFIRLTGYHWKSAIRLLRTTLPKPVIVYVKGKAVKLKPEKKRSANRKGKRIYTDEVIRCLWLVWTFF